MPQYIMLFLKNDSTVGVSTYYSDTCTPSHGHFTRKYSADSSTELLAPQYTSNEVYTALFHTKPISSGITSFSISLEEAVGLLETGNRLARQLCFFIGNPGFSAALLKMTGGKLSVFVWYDFNNTGSESLLISYLEVGGVDVTHSSSATHYVPEEAIHADCVLSSAFAQRVNLARTRQGRERILSLITDHPHRQAIQESHSFIHHFRNDTTIKKMADCLGRISFNITAAGGMEERGLNTSLLIDQSMIDSKSIYSRVNLEEKSIQGYRRAIRDVEAITNGMVALDDLKGMIERNNICPELLAILRERSEINSIRDITSIIRDSDGGYTVLGDSIAYVVGPEIDAYLDVCRGLYEKKLMACQETIDEIQSDFELEIYFGNDREICLMRRNSNVERSDREVSLMRRNNNLERSRIKAGQRLFVIKESKTMTLYSTRELKGHNKAIRGYLDQIIEIEGRLCKAVLHRLQRHESFFTKVTELVTTLDQLISNLSFSLDLGFKRPKISNSTAIYKASHVLFPGYQRADYLFEMGVYVITGANMAGKSCYVRNFLHLAVLVKTGCYVECEAAEVPLFDEIYSIGNIADLNVLVSNILRRQYSPGQGYRTPTRLVAVDELHCSTSIQLHLLELLRHSRTLTLFITHRSELIDALKDRGYEIYRYENYQLKKGENRQLSVAKICERYFPELNGTL